MAEKRLRDLRDLFRSKAARRKAKKVWREYKKGQLHHGGTGKVVRRMDVARAIMFSQAEKARARSRKLKGR